MQLSDTSQMAIQFNTIAREKMGDKVDKFCIFNVNDDVNHRAFSIDFEALPCPFLCTMWSIFMSRKKYSKAFKLRLLKKHNETGISY